MPYIGKAPLAGQFKKVRRYYCGQQSGRLYDAV